MVSFKVLFNTAIAERSLRDTNYNSLPLIKNKNARVLKNSFDMSESGKKHLTQLKIENFIYCLKKETRLKFGERQLVTNKQTIKPDLNIISVGRLTDSQIIFMYSKAPENWETRTKIIIYNDCTKDLFKKIKISWDF